MSDDERTRRSSAVATASTMDPGSSLVDAVVRLERAIVRIGTMRLTPWGITLSSYTAMKVMDRRPDLSLVRLSRRCFVRPQTMTRMVSGLENRGFVERLPNPESERALRLRLTALGQSVLADMDLAVNSILDTIGGQFDDAEIKHVDGVLRRLATAVETEIELLS